MGNGPDTTKLGLPAEQNTNHDLHPVHIQQVAGPSKPSLARAGSPNTELGRLPLIDFASSSSSSTEDLSEDENRRTVATRLDWKWGGENVFVTGTIFQWNRKQRLRPM